MLSPKCPCRALSLFTPSLCEVPDSLPGSPLLNEQVNSAELTPADSRTLPAAVKVSLGQALTKTILLTFPHAQLMSNSNNSSRTSDVSFVSFWGYFKNLTLPFCLNVFAFLQSKFDGILFFFLQLSFIYD
jgi:hypothetical protein